MLKIAIDLTSLYNRKITGLEGYAIDLYKALLSKENVELYPVFRCKNSLDSNENSVIIHHSKRFPVEQFLLPYTLRKMDVDVILYPVIPPGFLTYRWNRNKKIIPVIHDAGVWNHSQTLSLKTKIYLKPLYNFALKQASQIVTISETSKRKIQHFTSKEILNFSESISDIYDQIQTIETNICERLNINKEKFILSVSTIEPRKNLTYLLEIYKGMLRRGFDKKLVLVGRKGWGDNNKLKNLIDELQDNLIFTEYISNEDLITLYKSCSAFFLLSLEEGFGRPPLEALACGAKVFVSDIPIFREILKDNVVYLPLGKKNKAIEMICNEKIDRNQYLIHEYSFEAFKNTVKPEKLYKNTTNE